MLMIINGNVLYMVIIGVTKWLFITVKQQVATSATN